MDDICHFPLYIRTALKIRIDFEFGERFSVDEYVNHLFNYHLSIQSGSIDRYNAIVHEVHSHLNMLPNHFRWENMVIYL